MRGRHLLVLALWALAAASPGCGSDAPVISDASVDPDAAVDADAGALYSCDTETRAVPYMAGLERTSVSGAFKAVLVSSVPAPPSKGQNVWTVQIFDGSGAPQDGLTVTAVPSMPDHVHPAAVKPVVTPKNDGSGTYVLDPVYLFMAGFWEVKLTLQPAQPESAPKDTVVFPICIRG